MHRVFFSSRATKTGAIDTTFGSNGIPTCRRLRDICGVGDRLKTVPHSANTTWILIFCRVRMGQGAQSVPLLSHFVPFLWAKIAHYPLENGPHYPLETRSHYPLRGYFWPILGQWPTILSQWPTFGPLVDADFSLQFQGKVAAVPFGPPIFLLSLI